MSVSTLATVLADWTDIDFAAHALARCLGLLPHESGMSDAKWVYWSNNPLGNQLVALLDQLTALGFLEKRDEPDLQYRVRTGFRHTLDIETIWDRPRQASTVSLTLVVLRCANVERSRQFYEALGLSFRSEQHGAGPAHYSTRLRETVLELYPGAVAPGTPIRLGLAVPDVALAVETVRALGDFVVKFDSGTLPSQALVRDPDGNKIDLTSQGD